MLIENPIRWMDLGSLIEFDRWAVLEWTHSVEMALAVMVLHHFPPSVPQLWIGQAYQPAQATAYRLGAPNACLSSDKMDFQFSQGSQTGSGRLESRQTFSTPLPLLTFLFAIWCFSFYLQLCPSSSVSPDLTQSPPPDSPAWPSQNGIRLVVRVKIPVVCFGKSSVVTALTRDGSSIKAAGGKPINVFGTARTRSLPVHSSLQQWCTDAILGTCWGGGNKFMAG